MSQTRLIARVSTETERKSCLISFSLAQYSLSIKRQRKKRKEKGEKGENVSNNENAWQAGRARLARPCIFNLRTFRQPWLGSIPPATPSSCSTTGGRKGAAGLTYISSHWLPEEPGWNENIFPSDGDSTWNSGDQVAGEGVKNGVGNTGRNADRETFQPGVSSVSWPKYRRLLRNEFCRVLERDTPREGCSR